MKKCREDAGKGICWCGTIFGFAAGRGITLSDNGSQQ